MDTLPAFAGTSFSEESSLKQIKIVSVRQNPDLEEKEAKNAPKDMCLRCVVLRVRPCRPQTAALIH
jgi:hypothetical protein